MAAALEGDPPAPALEASEAIARRRRRSHPPPRRGGVRLLRTGRSQQEEKGAGPFRGQVQATARLEVEAGTHPAGDRGGGAQAKRFFHGPQRLPFGHGSQQKQAPWIEAEVVQAMAVWLAALGDRPLGDHQKPHPPGGDRTAEKGGHEAKGRRSIALALGGKLVEEAKGEPSRRQMPVDRRSTQRQADGALGHAARSRHERPQAREHRGTP